MSAIRVWLVLSIVALVPATALAQWWRGLLRNPRPAPRFSAPRPLPHVPPSAAPRLVPPTPPPVRVGEVARVPALTAATERSAGPVSRELGSVHAAGANGDWVALKGLTGGALARPGALPAATAESLRAVRVRAERIDALRALKAALDGGTPAARMPVPEVLPAAVRAAVREPAQLEDLIAALKGPWVRSTEARLEPVLTALATHADAKLVAGVRVRLALRAADGGDPAAARQLVARHVPAEDLPVNLRNLPPIGRVEAGPGVGAGRPTDDAALDALVARARARASRATDESIEFEVRELQPDLLNLQAHARELADRAAEEERADAEDAAREATGFARDPAAPVPRREPGPNERAVERNPGSGFVALGAGALLILVPVLYVLRVLVSGRPDRDPVPDSSWRAWGQDRRQDLPGVLFWSALALAAGAALVWWGFREVLEPLWAWCACAGACATGVGGAATAWLAVSARRARPSHSDQRVLPIYDSRGAVTGWRLPRAPEFARAPVPSRARGALGGAVAACAVGFVVGVFPGWRERAAFDDLREHGLALARGGNEEAALARADELAARYPRHPAAAGARTEVRTAVAEYAADRWRFDRVLEVARLVLRDDPGNERAWDALRGVLGRLDAVVAHLPSPDELESARQLVDALRWANAAPEVSGARDRPGTGCAEARAAFDRAAADVLAHIADRQARFARVRAAEERAAAARRAEDDGRVEDAVREYREAHRLAPPDRGSPDFRLDLLACYLRAGRPYEAAGVGAEIWPGRPVPGEWRGELRYECGDFAGAAADYHRRLERHPGDWVALSDLAWLLATCPDPEFRDGAAAVKIAEGLLVWSRSQAGSGLEAAFASHERYLGFVAAAAHAEAGDFVRARATVNGASELDARMRGQGRSLAHVWQERAAGVSAAVEAGRPYRCLPFAPAPRSKPERCP